MAPIIVEKMQDFHSQLTQELDDRDSQISRLEGENARLRALLEAVAVSNKSVPASSITTTTTTDTPGVESQPRVITAEDQRQTEEDLLDEACDVTEVGGAQPPQLVGRASGQLNSNRRIGTTFRRPNWSSDDDEDPVPVPEKEKAPVVAAAKDAAKAGANKRKRATESCSSSYSKLSESLSGLAVDELRARDQSLPASDQSDSQESDTRSQHPAKKPRPSGRTKKPLARNTQTPTKKQTRPPHPYTPLGKSPFQRSPGRATPPPPPPPPKQQTSLTFRYPGSSGSNESNATRATQPVWPKKTTQPKPSSYATEQPTSNAISKRTLAYAEITPFTFKFVQSYATSPSSTEGETLEMGVHESTGMTGTMSSFWKILTALRNTWEDQAGADWAWEVQKKVKSRARGRGRTGNGSFKRFCVSSRLANRPTKWRPGDTGFYACLECAGAAKPCFTWARDEHGEGGDDGDEFSAPPGEFWCLPVHKEDRRCVNVDGREMRIWVNEGESSSDEGDSSESGSSSGAVDEYNDDDSELTSEESSGESSEDHGRESSGDEL